MRVAYPMRVDALDKPGGDVVLMRTYIEHCGRAAARQGRHFEGLIMTDLDPDLSSFDLVHLTNLDRPVDLYQQFKAARRAGKPTVLTPLHHSYEEIGRYEKRGRGGTIGLLSGAAGFYRLETARILLKSWQYSKLRPALSEILSRGIRSAQAEVVGGVDVVLVAAGKELDDIEREISPLSRPRVVTLRNGFAIPDVSSLPAPAEREIDICVMARIEARKNQISILQALESLGLRGIFVGHENPNHKGYCRRFKRLVAKSRSQYIGGVSHERGAALLRQSRVHVAASWFEVSSLVDVEAYALGCRVVASQCGGTMELLGDDAYYVDPASRQSIARQISAAIESSRRGKMNSIDLSAGSFETWEQIGERLIALYSNRVTEMVTPA